MAVEGITLERSVNFTTDRFGAREMRPGGAPPPSPARIPKISRQMALALRMEAMIHAGEVETHEELARMGRVTQAYISKIMALLNLAPDLQEALLFWPRVEQGRPPVKLRDLGGILKQVDWGIQRVLWEKRGWPRLLASPY